MPLGTPNIYCIGRNYRDHALELANPIPKEPVVFLKGTRSLRPLDSREPKAFSTETFHHEIEVVLRLGSDLPMGTQGHSAHIGQVTLGLDLTRREVQSELKAKGLPWTLAKSFQGSAVIGTWVIPPPTPNWTFSLWVNQELRQEGATRDMLFDFATLITYLASFQSLQAGDLIYTGTPAGVGPIRVGDHVRWQSKELAIDESGYL